MSALTKHVEPKGEVVTPQAQGEDAWLSMIERAARDPLVDVSKMERMFEMRERVMKADAIQAFNAAFVEVKRKVGPVVRNLKNDQTRSKYADLFAIADVLDPVMTEFGFAPTFGTAESPKPGFYRITGTLMHSAGHSKDYFADIPIDDAGLKGNANKTATHAFGSTLTYGRRYLKVAMFDLATTDNDGNRPAPRETAQHSAHQSASGGIQRAKDGAHSGEDGDVPDYTADPEWSVLCTSLGNCESKADVNEWWEGRKKELRQRKPHFTKAFFQTVVIPTAASFEETVWEDAEPVR